MNHRSYRRSSRRRRRLLIQRISITALCLTLTGGLLAAGFIWGKKLLAKPEPGREATQTINQEPIAPATAPTGVTQAADIPMPEVAIAIESPTEDVLKQAALLAQGYDYDAAIQLLKQDPTLQAFADIQQAIADYEATKETLIRVNPRKVTHVFFHSLIVDNQKAFDGDADSANYNQVMTTTGEFVKILESMYAKGYVLVRLHDLAAETTDEDGKTVMKAGDILLPEGKIPFVMSQDDLNYYPYMDGDGFATRIVIGADGKPTAEMELDDGTIVASSFDLVPILEDFIQEHPDFSYKGARAVLALTGYEGIFGYRTAAKYGDPNNKAFSGTYEQDREAAAQVAQCLREHGWELASHTWGHRYLDRISEADFKADSKRWEDEVQSLIGPTDILLYPYGADVGDWLPYADDNWRFNYLYSLGFRYFCNVDSAQYWVQIGDSFLRQGRRNLDGYRMWKDISAPDPSGRKLEDLFHAEDVFDPDRPTPVKEMSGSSNGADVAAPSASANAAAPN